MRWKPWEKDRKLQTMAIHTYMYIHTYIIHVKAVGNKGVIGKKMSFRASCIRSWETNTLDSLSSELPRLDADGRQISAVDVNKSTSEGSTHNKNQEQELAGSPFTLQQKQHGWWRRHSLSMSGGWAACGSYWWRVKSTSRSSKRVFRSFRDQFWWRAQEGSE